MKRSGPLRRLTPLPAPVAPLGRRTRLRARGGQRGPDRAVRAAVAQRDRGCRLAGRLDVACWGPCCHLHHIRRRSQGGSNDADNLVALCPGHHAWVHEHPRAAAALGLLAL